MRGEGVSRTDSPGFFQGERLSPRSNLSPREHPSGNRLRGRLVRFELAPARKNGSDARPPRPNAERHRRRLDCNRVVPNYDELRVTPRVRQQLQMAPNIVHAVPSHRPRPSLLAIPSRLPGICREPLAALGGTPRRVKRRAAPRAKFAGEGLLQRRRRLSLSRRPYPPIRDCSFWQPLQHASSSVLCRLSWLAFALSASS